MLNYSVAELRINFAPQFDSPMQKVNRLKVILTEKKLTNLWLARQLDVNPTTVSKWCTNSSQPDILTFLKIASLLQLDVNALYDEKVVSDISEGIGVYEL